MTYLSKHWRAIAQYLSVGFALALITFICFQLRLSLTTATFLYLIVIVLLSLRGSFLASAIVSFVAVGLLDYYFAPPIFSLSVAHPADVVTIIVFLTTSAVITRLVSRVRELMQEKLRQSEAYLAEAQRLSHTGSFGWRVSTGEILWSEETLRIFQYGPSTKPTVELVLQRVHPEDTPLVKQTIERASQDNKDFEIEHRLLMPDGFVKYVHVVVHAERDKSGEPCFVGAVMDVTERRRAEEALRKAHANLARVTRLTSDANRGSDVITRIRGLLKQEQPSKARSNINEVVRETIALARADLQGTVLQTELASSLPDVTGDRVLLQQVLLNLTVNAIEAMKPVTDRSRLLRIHTKDYDGHAVLVAVQDSGVGFNSKQIDQIFETFYTTKPDGLGMGLSICRSIIEGYGGRLWAEPNGGPGATFQFTLPIESGGTA